MLPPRWPVPERVPRRLTSPEVRRRFAAASRRGLRVAVTAGGSLIALAVGLDAVYSLLTLGPAGAQMAMIQLVELLVVAGLVWMASIRLGRIELLALALAVIAFGLTLVRLAVLPESTTLSVSYLVTVLVGSGLFLPWSSRWHATWLAIAFVLAALAVVAIPQVAAQVEGPGTLGAIGLAGLVSLFGHRMWQQRLRHMLEQQFALRELSRYAKRQEVHVTDLNRELNRAVRRDSLTGIGNRLALDEALAGLLDPADRLRPRRFALVLLDIDHFKVYNDEHGHMTGDAALERFGEILRRATRGDDMAFRYGGEEFLLLLPGIELDAAIAVAERVRLAVVEDDIGGLPPFTISAGVALCDPAEGRDPEPLLRCADVALYRAKAAGRNRVAADELSVARQAERSAVAR